jgi:glycosyltransferase involved in cell wall biosynthesis
LTQPGLAFLCATYLKPEMLHVYRQITSLQGFRVRVITQKVENREAFPFEPIDLVARSRTRWIARSRERWLKSGPWQVGGREVEEVLSLVDVHDIRVLHIFFGSVAIHWLPLLRKCRIPVVVSFHGADVAGEMAGASHRRSLSEMLDRAALFPCRSEDLAKRVIAMGANPGKIRVSRTVVPELPLRYAGAERSRRVLQASRLIPKKGLRTTLNAFALARRSVPDATLVICGDGPMRGELETLAATLGVASSVHFTGFLDQERLTSELRDAAIFVHPSESVNGDTEGIPNSLLEAMAMGIPVLATKHGGIPEAVTDGETGYLMEERDVAGLARRMTELLCQPNENERLGCTARASVRHRFSQDAAAAALGEMYRGLI